MNDSVFKQLWEILVPATVDGVKVSLEHHREWDAYVRELTNGLTVMTEATGQWRVRNGVFELDELIPVRLACETHQIMMIIDFTIKHYNQKAVMAYQISHNVIVKARK